MIQIEKLRADIADLLNKIDDPEKVYKLVDDPMQLKHMKNSLNAEAKAKAEMVLKQLNKFGDARLVKAKFQSSVNKITKSNSNIGRTLATKLGQGRVKNMKAKFNVPGIGSVKAGKKGIKASVPGVGKISVGKKGIQGKSVVPGFKGKMKF